MRQLVAAMPREDRLLPALSLAAALAVFAAYQVAAFVRAGVFEYPLDDVYIHLAMAEGIAAGGYGVNASEYASAASSPLYPFLLPSAGGAEVQRMLPLLWNVAGLAAAAWLWGLLLAEAGFRRLWAMAIAVAGPVALNMPGVAYLGMEHMLHAAASLATLLGLWRALNGGAVGLLLVAGVVLMSAFRLEGLAFGLLAAAAVAATGRPRAGALLAVLAVLPVLAFAAGLTALGLEPLPSSVYAKLADSGAGETAFLAGLLHNLQAGGGVLLAALSLGLLALSAVGRVPALRVLALALALTGAAHLLAGQIGWMNRYEHYAVVVLAAGLCLLLAERRGAAMAMAIVLAAAGTVYLPRATGSYLNNPGIIHRQQAQMARFAQDYVQAPVAVNDLGRVAWGNPHYVLDLWGLASPEAREARLASEAPGWAGPLARRHGAVLAMVYEGWLGAAVPPGWQRLGRLETRRVGGFIGGFDVTFYATDPAEAGRLAALLQEFAPTLPEGARFVFAEGAP